MVHFGYKSIFLAALIWATTVCLWWSVHGQSAFCSSWTPSVPIEECEALVSLYTYTNWNNRDDQTWRVDSYDVWSWYGVEVASHDWVDHVVWLTLSDNNLAWVLHTDIDQLWFLETLLLDWNALTAVSSELWNIWSLQTLDLRAWVLTSLPTGLWRLDALTILKLDNNQLTALPDDLWSLWSLDYLWASYNQLSSIPATFWGLDDLDYIDLSNNQFTDFPDGWSVFSDIDILLVNDNQLTTLSPQVDNFSQARQIDISWNQLTDSLISFVWFTRLESLDISWNQLTELPLWVAWLSLLESLYASNNLLTDLPDLSWMTWLLTLYVNNNQLLSLPNSLGWLSLLRYMYAHSNAIIWTIPSSYTWLTALRRFHINDNALDRLVDHTASIPPETQVWFDTVLVKDVSSQRDETIPVVTVLWYDSVYTLSWTLSLTLWLDENSYLIDSAGSWLVPSITWPASCDALSVDPLTVQGTSTVQITLWAQWAYEDCLLSFEDHGWNVSSAIPLQPLWYWSWLVDFCLLPGITVPSNECVALVDFYESLWWENWINTNNWFETPVVEDWFWVETWLVDWVTHVVWLYLHKAWWGDSYGPSAWWIWNNLVGTIPESIGTFSQLKKLNLSANGISGLLPDALDQLTVLEELYLWWNQLTWWVPESLSSLIALRRFSLPNNQLSWPLPEFLGWLWVVEIIDVYWNEFTWSIPLVWDQLTSLWSLRLWNNELSGTIPWFLWSFSWLKYLHLWWNQLTWTIPDELAQLSLLETLQLQNNALDRTNTDDAILTPIIQNWYVTLNTTSVSEQDDITPPVISWTGAISWLVEDTFERTVTVDENSYAVNAYNQWMSVLFSGSSLCEQLSTDQIIINEWSVLLTISTGDYWLYDSCELSLRDHWYNSSQTLVLPTFWKAEENHEICYNPDMTISLDQCLALVEFYEESWWATWLSSTGRLSVENISWWLWITTAERNGETVVVWIDLSNNDLEWTVSLGEHLSTLETVMLADNNLTLLATEWENLTALTSLDISGNQFSGLLPSALSSLWSLTLLDVSSNQFTWSLPESWVWLSLLETLLVDNNQLSWTVPSFITAIASLRTIDLSENMFWWKIPQERIAHSGFTHLYLQNNYVDRDAWWNAVGEYDTSLWEEQLTAYDWSNQTDVTAPQLFWSWTIPETIGGLLTIWLDVIEWSDPLNGSGVWMQGIFVGSSLCESLQLTQPITHNQWVADISIIPWSYGTYSWCALGVTDHWGNTWRIDLSAFDYTVACGNWDIEWWEDCDEWKFCNDWRSCTDDISICPFECQTRFKEWCNPLCQETACGDGFVDTVWQDQVPQTWDDEFCDEGKFCNDGTPCTDDPSVCGSGASECITRFTQTCTPYCSLSSCGDGFVDRDWPDNIFDTPDDELCDDWNYDNGDWCNSFCAIEWCGDGFLDADWPDNDLETSADNEQCDLWQNNWLLWSNCSSTCTIPWENCVFCYETCDWWDGEHSLFLMIDVSWSMWSDNKLEKAKTWAIEFVNLVEDRATTNSDFSTKIWIIAFENYSWIEQTPTTNYQDVRDAIDWLRAWWWTNFGDAFEDAHDYFESNDTTVEQHVIILSDGLPTAWWWWNYYPDQRATLNADDLKDDDVSIYTISVELSTEWVDLMRQVSSSPIQNVAYNKNTFQSSTYSNYSSRKARDGNLSSYRRAQTYTNTNARWQIDLWALYNIKEIRLRNRRWNYAWKSSDYKILMSEEYFASQSLADTIAQSWVTYVDEPGQMQRPSYYNDIDTTLRYLRVQLDGTQSLSLAEVEILWCPNWVFCEDVYNYEDYQGDAIDLLYSHIFWAIHCNCKPEKLCGVCGDWFTQDIYGEDCDEWSVCSDWTDCTADPWVCPGECYPKQTSECSWQCTYTTCGDGTIQAPNHDWIVEECDDSNVEWWDGCTDTCTIEFCGDGFTDSNWTDNIRFTDDDEACDPNDPGIWAWCLADCSRDPAYLAQDWVCDGESFIYNLSWDWVNTPDVSSLCTVWEASDFTYNTDAHTWTWYCVGVFGGETAACTVPERYCGDGLVQVSWAQQESCEDWNQQIWDGCSDTCLVEQPLLLPEGQWWRCLAIEQPVIQQGEFVPVWWNLLPVDDIDVDALSCTDLSAWTYIPWWSLWCHFSLYRWTPNGPEFMKTSSPISCLWASTPDWSGEFITDFFSDYGWDETLWYTLFDEQRSTTHPKKWKYFVRLEKITYTFCGLDDTWEQRSSDIVRDEWGLCYYDYSVTSPYLTQQWTSFGSVVAGPVAEEYTDITWAWLFADGVIPSMDHTEILWYNNEIIAYLSEKFVKKHRWTAIIPVFPFGVNQPMNKTPTKSVYFYVGDWPWSSVTITDRFLAQEDVYTLVVVNADLVISWSLEWNGLHIVLWWKTIFAPQSCDVNDFVRWMFLSEFWFESPLLHNTFLWASERCKWWWLVLDGLLLWPDSETSLLSKRRARLNLHNTTLQSSLNDWTALSDEQKKIIRKNQSTALMDWSAVRIKANSTRWNELPIWATDLFDAVEVYK